MSSYSRIRDLASRISRYAIEIETHLSSQNIAQPNFEPDSPFELPPTIHTTQAALLEAADELTLLLQGPMQSLMHIAGYSHNARNSLHAIIRYDLATALPIDSTATFKTIALARGLNTLDTTRVLRHAMTYRIFSEPSPGVVSHTASSRLLAERPDLRAWIATTLDELLPAASRMIDAMEQWPGSEEPNEAGWNIANNESKPMFEVLGNDRKRAKNFAGSMTFFEARPGIAVKYLVEDEGLQWGKVKKMVDVGGSHGKVAIALARKYTGLSCIVQDLESVVSGAQVPADLVDSITFMPHDFFNAQPVVDADVYLLRWVLHDWSDKYAIKILRALVPAMRSGTKVVINESCLPDFGTMSLYGQRFLRATDLTMKQIQNARERDQEDWTALVKSTDSRYHLQSISRPEGSELAIITLVWQ
ncbi:hypothetical protein NHQ30_007736 [Ciborinia camelliae]|nr:hypothetical protein NHQ30_007736 [Ciborinia camelliae]